MTARWERGERRQPALPARSIAAAVLRTGRRHAGRILIMAIAVSVVVTAVEIAVDHLLSHAGLSAALFGALGSSGVSLLGAVFLAGSSAAWSAPSTAAGRPGSATCCARCPGVR
jgi:hypothetical protein